MLIGNPALFHVGGHLLSASDHLGIRARLLDANEAFAVPCLLAKFNWWLLGHRPGRIRWFGERVVSLCREVSASSLLTTGLAPVSSVALAKVGRLGITRLNYLTDDPWNPAHRAPWFMQALRQYDVVFSPRRATIDDLHRHGCRRVEYLPFAYSPDVHFAEAPPTGERDRWEADILFVGSADSDRLRAICVLTRAGFRVALYGGFWDRCEETRSFHRGHADLPTLRKATAGAKMVLGLVRRANRDGHAMRSFEVPAMGGCMLTEETEEHRELFGPEGECTVYFRDEAEMLKKARWLLDHPEERSRLAAAAHARVTGGRNTYADRLKAMLEATGPLQLKHD